MLPRKQLLFRRGLAVHCSLTPSPPPRKPSSLSILADQCKSMHQLKQIHAQMIVSARIQDNFAASRLLSFCALSESGDLNYASKLFNRIEEPNSFMWNTMLRAYASGSQPSEALFLYIKMKFFEVVPGKHTYPFLLKACSKLGSILSSKQVHTHVLKSGLDLDLHIVKGLVRAYSVSKKIDYARQVFDEAFERNLSIWTTMICGYAQNCCPDDALELFDEMIVQGFEPNGVTLASVLSACAQSGCFELGDQIRLFIKRKGIEVGVILGTALVHMYAKNGAISIAKELFDNLLVKNVVTWNAMICGLAAHGHVDEALALFRGLESEQIEPNDRTFVGVLSACCHAGYLDVGREIFDSMKSMYGIDPKIEHYGCMVDLLGRSGKVVEAEELMKSMTWKADVVILGALLTACKNHGNFEVAERVVEQILQLEPHNHGVFVVLSNMYAEAGRWEEVSKLRKLMKKRKPEENTRMESCG